jgi:hypothetical protein
MDVPIVMMGSVCRYLPNVGYLSCNGKKKFGKLPASQELKNLKSTLQDQKFLPTIVTSDDIGTRLQVR